MGWEASWGQILKYHVTHIFAGLTLPWLNRQHKHFLPLYPPEFIFKGF